LGLSVLAELLVAWVIFYELEAGRLDSFLSDAGDLTDERNKIYKAFCGLPQPGPGKTRSVAFAEYLESSEDGCLLDACYKNIRLFNRIGARLPKLWSLRRTPLDWHVAAVMWMILGPYVDKRRDESGRSYAESFLMYALASTGRLLKQKNRLSWTVRDPDRARKQDVVFTRQEFVAAKADLKRRLRQER